MPRVREDRERSEPRPARALGLEYPARPLSQPSSIPCFRSVGDPNLEVAMRFLNFLVLLFLPAVVLAQPRAGGPQVPGLIQAEVTFRHEDLRIDQDGEYHRLRLRGTMLDRSPEHAGDPQLPMANRWFVLPPGYTVE